MRAPQPLRVAEQVERGVHHLRSRGAAWLALALVAALLPMGVNVVSGNPAGAQTSVAPVLSCPAGMTLDASSGMCRTPRTETALRPSSCPPGWSKVAGEYGGHVCQTKVVTTIDTGRTRQVYSHTTYKDVWIVTGTRRVQTGTKSVWVPPKETVEPLVPPIRVRVGTKRKCDFDPVLGVEFNCRNVGVYETRTSQQVTIPGYWTTEPTYGEKEVGYWDRVPTIHYTNEPIYETSVSWRTSAPSLSPCPSGWQVSGSQCSRTVLGDPSAAPTQRCPSGSVPSYDDALGGNGLSTLTCRSSAPGSETDTGTSQKNSGGSDTSRDGASRPLHHLAGESDERLAELGIHRCANGLLSYVPCDELPGRSWNSDASVCDDIEGTTYRAAHGGTCVTSSDLLNKCTKPGDCEETTIRTYCPAIGELADTQIQEHVHPSRGAETYRVCVFDCSSFSTLPPYVQTRINGSYDYGCLPVEESEPPDSSAPTTTTTASEPDPEDPEDPEEDGDEDSDDDSDPGDPNDIPDPKDDPDPMDPIDPGDPVDIDDPPVGTTAPPTTAPPTTVAPDPNCGPRPALSPADANALRWESNVRSSGTAQSGQRDMPGGGRYVQVAPGRGWMRALRPMQIGNEHCTWNATQVRSGWSELRPWVASERRLMEAEPSTSHLVDRWDALSVDQQQLLRRWHRPGASPAEVVCSAAEAAAGSASSACGWLLRHPAAYAWSFEVCLEAVPVAPGAGGGAAQPGSPPSGDDCWVTLASGVDWIRPVGDYADSRVSGSAPRTQP